MNPALGLRNREKGDKKGDRLVFEAVAVGNQKAEGTELPPHLKATAVHIGPPFSFATTY